MWHDDDFTMPSGWAGAGREGYGPQPGPQPGVLRQPRRPVAVLPPDPASEAAAREQMIRAQQAMMAQRQGTMPDWRLLGAMLGGPAKAADAFMSAQVPPPSQEPTVDGLNQQQLAGRGYARSALLGGPMTAGINLPPPLPGPSGQETTSFIPQAGPGEWQMNIRNGEDVQRAIYPADSSKPARVYRPDGYKEPRIGVEQKPGQQSGLDQPPTFEEMRQRLGMPAAGGVRQWNWTPNAETGPLLAMMELEAKNRGTQADYLTKQANLRMEIPRVAMGVLGQAAASGNITPEQAVGIFDALDAAKDLMLEQRVEGTQSGTPGGSVDTARDALRQRLGQAQSGADADTIKTIAATAGKAGGKPEASALLKALAASEAGQAALPSIYNLIDKQGLGGGVSALQEALEDELIRFANETFVPTTDGTKNVADFKLANRPDRRMVYQLTYPDGSIRERPASYFEFMGLSPHADLLETVPGSKSFREYQKLLPVAAKALSELQQRRVGVQKSAQPQKKTVVMPAK